MFSGGIWSLGQFCFISVILCTAHIGIEDMLVLVQVGIKNLFCYVCELAISDFS